MMRSKKKSKSVSMKKKKKKKSCIDWSELPSELLEIIGSKLKLYIDYVRFRAAFIKKWRSSASSPPNFPWLLFPYRSDTGTDCSFLDPSTNIFHPLNLTDSPGSRCCGSSLGWLVFLEESNPTIRLINPITRNVIHLPPVTALPNVLQLDRSNVGKEYLVQAKPDGYQFRSSMKDMRDLFIKKVVLSSTSRSLENDYVALVILNDIGHLAFHKKGGGEEWSIIEKAGECFYEDAIYYKGSFYALTTEGSIAICDLSGVSPFVTCLTLSSPTICDGVNYLVSSFGELMLVTRKIELLDEEFESGDDFQCESVYQTTDSSVFKYDSSNRNWVRMDTIGDQMMFLGGSSSVCLSASSDFSGCERNHIYFSSEIQRDHEQVVHGLYDCVVHRMDDGFVIPLPCADISSQHILHPPIWVTPNPF